MALFLGNLSPHVRHDELERVFQRFGQSNVLLKDGYGFVTYDVPVNAERALRVLRGKIICGERLSLTWANKQPRPFRKFMRNDRFLEFQRERNFARGENNTVRSRAPEYRRNFLAFKENYRKMSNGEVHGDKAEQIEVEKNERLKDKSMEEGNTLEPTPLENDRWGEPVGESLNDAVEDGIGFDRYEPYHGFDRRNEAERQHMSSSYGSGRDSSPEGAIRERASFDDPKPQQFCYNCGRQGHKMRYCPSAGPPRLKYGHRQNRRNGYRGRSEGQFRKPSHASWRKSDGRNGMALRRDMDKRRESDSRNLRRLAKRPEEFRKKREKRQLLLEGDSHGKKRGRKEHGSPRKRHSKKGRTSDSSLLLSDSGASFHSKTSSSNSESRISSRHSRSISSRSLSVSSSSRSASPSSFSESRSSRSKSRASSPRSLSLSVSLDRNSPKRATNEVDAVPSTDDSMKSENLLLKQKSSLVGALEISEHKDAVTSPQVGMNAQQIPEGGESALESAQNSKETDALHTSDPAQMEICPSLFKAPEALGTVSRQLDSSIRVSSHDMSMVLKHYGLNAPEESELEVPVDAFFGAARLWPWEVIYCRRLRKGPISTENYARRIKQNEEFGIVDKYIRSSSGWGECDV